MPHETSPHPPCGPLPPLPDKPPACAKVAAVLREPLRGTAAVSRGWLLIEHPGTWSRDELGALADMDPRASEAIAAAAESSGVRVGLIRDPARRATGRLQGDGVRTVLLARSLRPNPWVEQLQVNSLSEIADLDLRCIDRTTPPGYGTAVDYALLVCTHGRKDACCAVHGRPVVHTLTEHGYPTWEASHLGGDRFAAAVVALPEGIYYGHVDAGSAPAVAQAHRSQQVALAHFRGRCCDPSLWQMAEHAVRSSTQATGIDDVTALATRHRADGDVEVDVHTAVRGVDTFMTVRLRSSPLPPRLTSCTAGEWGSPDPHAVVSIEARSGT